MEDPTFRRSAPPDDARMAPCPARRCPRGVGDLDRRRFLELGVGAAAGAMVLHALSGCEISELRGAPGSTRLAFDLSDPRFQPLRAVGGLVAVDAGTRLFVLLRTSEAEIVALSRICTHEGCDLDPARSGTWRAASQELVCRCHGAVFDAQGSVLMGPARTPLKRYSVTFDGAAGRGTVDLS